MTISNWVKLQLGLGHCTECGTSYDEQTWADDRCPKCGCTVVELNQLKSEVN